MKLWSPNRGKEDLEEERPQDLERTAHQTQIEEIIRAIRQNATPEVDGHEARRDLQLLLAMYEASKTGREVKIIPDVQ